VGEAWGNTVLLAGKAGLSGAVHVEDARCSTPLGPRGGVTLARVGAAVRPGGGESARTRRERARAVARDGATWLTEGNFEAARKRFLEALEVDPRFPEALNGVGVTYRMRNDLPAALEWYKKALAVDPDFGDAYYNLACVYALQGRKDMALRYLQIAALNGYATAEGIDADPDLEALHGDPAYRALVKARL
jgi:tetratricopeptide (TPR) repeat protein